MSGAVLLVAAAGLLVLAASGGGGPTAGGPFGLAVAEAARRSIGVRETAPNSGPEIDTWLRELGIDPPAQWCAAAVSHWLREAARATGLRSPVKGSALAKGLLAQFQGAGRALTAAQARDRALPPGTVLFWDRPVASGSTIFGHTAVIEVDRGAEGWTTIEGNTAQNDVRRVQRPRDAPLLLGAGLVDGLAAFSSPGPSAPASSTPAVAPSSRPGVPPVDRRGLVCIAGDSLAEGIGPWLQTMLGPAVTVARRGSTIAEWAAPGGPLGDVLARRPALVVVSLGTNDIARAVNAETRREAIGRIVDQARATPASIAWVLPPSLPKPGYGVRAVMAQVLGDRAVPSFDSEALDFERAPDGVHATPRGYATWAAAIATWLRATGLRD